MDKEKNNDKEMEEKSTEHEELTEVPQNESNEEPKAENLTEGENAEKEEEQAPEKSWEEKYTELYDTYLRLFSEFDNFRKRSTKERSDLIRTAGADVIQSLLPVMDDFDRAKKSMEESGDVESLKTGVDLVYTKLNNVLTEKGLTEINPIGEPFDAEIHEAITNLPAPTEEEKGKVLDVVEKGYKLNDKIIRYPKVVVYS